MGFPKWTSMISSFPHPNRLVEVTIWRCVLNNDKHMWMMTEFGDGNGTSYDVEYYATREFNRSSTMKIPMSQPWYKRHYGVFPAPTVIKVLAKTTETEIDEIGQNQSFKDDDESASDEVQELQLLSESLPSHHQQQTRPRSSPDDDDSIYDSVSGPGTL